MKQSVPKGRPSTSSRKINDTQVDGTHYQTSTGLCPNCRTPIQHWDLFGPLPGLVYAATKYIIRHRDKGGKTSLEKAKHTIDKIIEQEYPEK